MKTEKDGITLEVLTGDISRQPDVTAIVNASNTELLPGSGVAGAIHDAAGPKLAAAGRGYAPLKPGEAVITGGFDLPNRYVIHCLGPVYGADEPSDQLLAECYRNALRLADEHEIPSIAFPAISTGAFGYPMDEAADVTTVAIVSTLPNLEHVRLVRLVLFDEVDRATFEQALKQSLRADPGQTP